MASSVDARIAEVAVTLYRVPLPRPWVSAAYTITHHEHTLVELTLENGLTGTGWSTTLGVAGAAVAAMIKSYLAPMCIGRSAHDHEALWSDLWRHCHQPGSGGISAIAVAGIDLALWDLRGKLAGMPVRRLLGGGADSVPVYASAANLNLAEHKLVEQTKQFLDAGNRLFKIKIGSEDADQDVSRVAAVRNVIGSLPLMLDANQRFKPGEALRRIAMLERFNPVWLEEPMLSEDIDNHARLAAQSRIPIALGEELSSRYEFWRYISSGAVSYVQPNVHKVGGISEWMKIAHIGMGANLTMAPQGALEASAIVASALPGCYPIENIDSGSFTDQGILEEPLRVEGGRVHLSPEPGLGVRFNREAMEAYRAPSDLTVSIVDRQKYINEKERDGGGDSRPAGRSAV
ncbi:mandelate racemase/muconate lactonizing enzyme family protein [Paraburkholderia sp. RP-4-7]|uniref:Mandelate racemase/muconate lactonizing enzyme family protein n=1 Tax=Paraburkholderia polaris TaxID=2728848 RepID=A0A848IQ91_9BURK|nr:mandelate racemase/muconate lactonizing enzyme family protein [Paraburkholderia polaris]NMM04422.1 mandelate racemase/muconate lactonizing enzyme family protein [Paraburkholderia polaris]